MIYTDFKLVESEILKKHIVKIEFDDMTNEEALIKYGSSDRRCVLITYEDKTKCQHMITRCTNEN